MGPFGNGSKSSARDSQELIKEGDKAEKEEGKGRREKGGREEQGKEARRT